MVKHPLVRAILWAVVVCLVVGSLAIILRAQEKPKDLKPIALSTDEAKMVDLLRNNWQEKAAEADKKRVEYERAIIARELASAEAGGELNRILQSKGGKFEDYDFSWQKKMFIPKGETAK